VVKCTAINRAGLSDGDADADDSASADFESNAFLWSEKNTADLDGAGECK
jgi:hypothetical protein